MRLALQYSLQVLSFQPSAGVQVATEELLQQAEGMAARRDAAEAGEECEGLAASKGLPCPQAVYGDSVRWFDETAAAEGSLGRFPSSELMPLIRQFLGRVGAPRA